MRRTPIDQSAFVQLRAEYLEASHGGKQEILERWADRLGITPGSLRNLIYKGQLRKPTIEELSPEKKRIAASVVALFEQMPFGNRTAKRVAWSRIVRLAEQRGLIRTGSITPREMGYFVKRYRLTTRHRVTRRFRRGTPNSLHQVDFSRSLVFKPAGHAEVGPMLQVLSKHQVPYLNKPQDGIRVWIGAVKDDASGVVFMHYYLARGEGNEQAIALLHDAWLRKENYPFWGVPKALYRDKASWGKTEQVRRLLEKLGVQDLTTSKAGEAWKKGKVEREFSTIKHGFENEIGLLGKGTLISLAEANAKLAAACMETNTRPHPDYKGYTRLEYFRKHVKEIWFPDNFDELAYQHHYGTVRRGIIRFKGVDYWAPRDVPDGRKVELVVLFGDVYLFIPGDRFGPARRILLQEALLNQAPPVDDEAEVIRSEIADKTGSLPAMASTEYDEILLDRLPETVSFSPPEATEFRRIEGAGVELLEARAQREALAAVLGPLGDLDYLAIELVNKFCNLPHSREEIERFADRVQRSLAEAPQEGVKHERKQETK